MEAAASSTTRIRAAVDALGAGPLDEAGLQRHVAPLFERMRAQAGLLGYMHDGLSKRA